MASTSPSQRALSECRKRDWPCGIVERYCSFTKRRHDLFGCIDLIALDGGRGALGIQVTSGSNHSARVKKTLEEPRILKWLQKGNRYEVWSYAKRGTAGKRKLWQLRIEAVTEDMYQEAHFDQ
jgi:hypothetical protein